jgi:hypothetical protein
VGLAAVLVLWVVPVNELMVSLKVRGMDREIRSQFCKCPGLAIIERDLGAGNALASSGVCVTSESVHGLFLDFDNLVVHWLGDCTVDVQVTKESQDLISCLLENHGGCILDDVPEGRAIELATGGLIE